MAKRRKKLTPKILTYKELDAACVRRKKRGITDWYNVPLRGCVRARAQRGVAQFRIEWVGNLRRAGGPDEVNIVLLAYVGASFDGTTSYEVVSGINGKTTSRIDLARLKIWQRYVRVFTPYDSRARLRQGHRAYYVVRDGTATRWHTRPPEWATRPTAFIPKPAEWVGQFPPRYRNLPKFIGRCKRFASDLKKSLADGPTCVVQLLTEQGRPCLQVCVPPTSTKHGGHLVVYMDLHDQESWRFFRITRDYGVRHSQYKAWDTRTPASTAVRWKTGKEALSGVVEWVLSSIHIPGPE